MAAYGFHSPMVFIMFLNWQLAAIVFLLQGLQCCQKQIVYSPILIITIFPDQSNTASSQYPYALSPTCTSSQLTVHKSFSNCDATEGQGLCVTYLLWKTMLLPSDRWAIQFQILF